MSNRWADRAYAILSELFPRGLPRDEMRLVFRNLLDDPEVSTSDLMKRVLSDLRHLAGGTVIGALLGTLAVLIWYVVRSDVVVYDPTVGEVEIGVLFVGAGFFGAWRSGTFLGGLMVGLAAGVVGSVTVPGDYLWFGVFPAGDVYPIVVMAAGAVIMLVSLGALLALSPSALKRRLPSRGDARSLNLRA